MVEKRAPTTNKVAGLIVTHSGNPDAHHNESHSLASHSDMTATSLIIENRTDDPATPANGQIWLRTDI